MTITIYNSEDKEQKRFTKATSKRAFKVLNRITGKVGWWAKAAEEEEIDILLYINGKWVN